MTSSEWVIKPWDMIVAEVEALPLDALILESWAWLDLEPFASAGHESILRRDIDGAVDEIDPTGSVRRGRGDLALTPPDTVHPLALQQVRNWCTHKRDEHGGRTPGQLEPPASTLFAPNGGGSR